MALIAMKRLRVIAPLSSRRALIKQMTNMGCVEVEAAANSTDFDTAGLLAVTTENTGAASSLAAVKAARQTLERLAPPQKRPMFAQKPEVTQAQLDDSQMRALEAAGEINSAMAQIEQISAQQAKSENAASSLEPWRTLDVPLDYTAGARARFILGVMPSAVRIDEVREELEENAPECALEVVSTDGEQHYLSVIAHESVVDDAMKILKKRGFANSSVKGEGGTALECINAEKNKIASLDAQRAELIAQIASHGDDRAAIELAIDAFEIEAQHDEVLSSLVHTRETIVLTGWIPQKAQESVRGLLEKFGCAYSMEDPQEGENPPTAMQNGKLAAPFGAVTEMYGMPVYGSVIDPNPMMVPFYLTFFGFIMGDAVYGIIIALGCYLGLKLMKPKGTMKQMLTLFMYCGFATIIAGVLVGGYLGDAIPQFTQAVFGKAITIPPLWFNPVEEPMKMLVFTIVLGAIQIVTGMAISAYRQIKEHNIIGALGDTLSWYLIFLGVGIAVVGLSFGTWVAVGGVVLMFVCAAHGKRGFSKITAGLGQLYSITGFVSDLLSYSRIMALGLSGAVVASVMNKMGAMGGGGIGGILLFIGVGLIGHTFNIAISLLGAYVHTSRLQYIEFFGRFYEGGGRPMRPLTNKTKYVEIITED